MKIKIAREPYECDVLFRVYRNQTGHQDGRFFFEVMKKEELRLPCTFPLGRYSSAHPQGVRNLLEKLYLASSKLDITIQLSNEWIDDVDTEYRKWFDSLFKSIEKGEILYEH